MNTNTGSTSPPRLIGVLVAYRREHLLPEVLSKILDQERTCDELIVVDNGSSRVVEDLVQSAGQQHPEVTFRYVDAGENLGPAGGWALGMGVGLETATDDDWFLTLDDNNPPQQKDELRRVFDAAVAERARDASVAAVGIVGSRFNWTTGLLERLPDDALHGVVDVDYLGGGHMSMYSAAVMRSAGSFDPCLFFGSVEIEIGLRLKKAGYRVLSQGDVWRERRVSANRMNTEPATSRRCTIHWQKYYRIRNYIFMMRRLGHTWLAWKWALIQCVAKPAYTLFSSPRLAWQGFWQASRAARDGFSGRMGRTLDPSTLQFHYGSGPRQSTSERSVNRCP